MEEEIVKEKLEAESNRLNWEKRTPNCPDCRSDLTTSELEYFQNIKLKNIKESDSDYYKKNIVISDSIRQMQKKMRIIFEKQKDAGGIIDEAKQEIIMITVILNLLQII